MSSAGDWIWCKCQRSCASGQDTSEEKQVENQERCPTRRRPSVDVCVGQRHKLCSEGRLDFNQNLRELQVQTEDRERECV